jgi:hypothetical protein
MTKQFGAGLALGIIATILVAIAAWLTVAYTGAYNVAASDRHFDAVRWTLDTTMHRSVSSRSGGAELPEVFSPELIGDGARHYAESCAHCHGTPGGEPAGWSRGMRPEPPHLTEAASEWTSQEIHWIVSNGVKMSGMPAFASRHAPEEIVALTAFVTALPGLSAEDYAALAGSAPDQQEQPAAAGRDDPDRDVDDGAAEPATE